MGVKAVCVEQVELRLGYGRFRKAHASYSEQVGLLTIGWM